MTVEEAIRTRQSIRTYSARPVDRKTVNQLLESARLAPSATNRQEWRFVVVTDGEKRREIARAAAGQSFVGEAPVVIVCCAETDYHKMRSGYECYLLDVAIAIDHITLRAVELGLGTCWVGSFYEDEIKKILRIPEHIRVVELLTVGYPRDKEVKPKKRLELQDIAYFEEWGRRD